jgi:hypothetical protein
MRQKSFLLVFFLFALGSVSIQAQKTIIEYLESQSKESEGIIRIESDPAITALIGKPSASRTSNASVLSEQTERSSFGFRVQVFMGNDLGTARSEASRRQVSIKKVFPHIATYLSYEAPNWKLVVGDFFSREEAGMFKQKLQKEFPRFSKELFITVEKIKIPVEKNE